MESCNTTLPARPPGNFAGSLTHKPQAIDSEIIRIESFIEEVVKKHRVAKLQLEQHVRKVLSAAQRGLLCNCKLEVVGSVSWDGDVPQSDLDLMLCTPQMNSDNSEAIALLQALSQGLETQVSTNIELDHVEVLSTARVPILRVQDSRGYYCDIAVDQSRSIGHRDFLLKALDGRPHVRSFLRLVKFWLRQRGLPSVPEGGLPSLAWVFAALSLADSQPEGVPVEVLLMHFFSQLHKLGSQFLDVRFDCFSLRFQAQWQSGWIATWSEEWTELFRVADPSSSHAHLCVTPPSMPTALGLLYVAELRLAWSAVQEKQWRRLWDYAPEEMQMDLPSAVLLEVGTSSHSLSHVVLKDSIVYAGSVEEAILCPGLPPTEVLHRRDQSSNLSLCPGMPTSSGNQYQTILSFQPCHWICTLPSQEWRMLQGEGVLRVLEIALMVGIARLSSGLQHLVATMKPTSCGYAPTPACYVWMPVTVPATTSSMMSVADSNQHPIAVPANNREVDVQPELETRHVDRPRSPGAPCKRIKQHPLNKTWTTLRTQVQQSLVDHPRDRSPNFSRSDSSSDPGQQRYTVNRRRAQQDLVELGSDDSTRASDTEDLQPERSTCNESSHDLRTPPQSSQEPLSPLPIETLPDESSLEVHTDMRASSQHAPCRSVVRTDGSLSSTLSESTAAECKTESDVADESEDGSYASPAEIDVIVYSVDHSEEIDIDTAEQLDNGDVLSTAPEVASAAQIAECLGEADIGIEDVTDDCDVLSTTPEVASVAQKTTCPGEADIVIEDRTDDGDAPSAAPDTIEFAVELDDRMAVQFEVGSRGTRKRNQKRARAKARAAVESRHNAIPPPLPTSTARFCERRAAVTLQDGTICWLRISLLLIFMLAAVFAAFSSMSGVATLGNSVNML
jgi:hypothetical protein